MSQELTNPKEKKMFICLTNGVNIEIEADRAERLIKAVFENDKPFLEIKGKLINASHIVGVFDEMDMYERQQEKRGLWKCGYDKWHDKKEFCECARYKQIIYKTPDKIDIASIETITAVKKELLKKIGGFGGSKI